MGNDLKWMMVSDVHFPRHDPRKVELFLKVMKWWQPDAVDLLGDIDDADSTSRWADGSPDAWVSLEDGGVDGTKQFMSDIRSIVKKADCHFHDGNHGWTRHGKFIASKAPQLLDFVTSKSLYEYDKYGFNWHEYNEPPVKRFGDMYAHHGESISKHAGESVRNDVLNWGISLVRGHSHRMGAYFKTYDMTGQKLRGYEIGHLCDQKKMDYTLGHDWQAGFAIAHVVNDFPHMQLIQINEDDMSCVVDGKLFKA